MATLRLKFSSRFPGSRERAAGFQPSFLNTIAVYLTRERDALRNINAGKSVLVIPAIYVVLRNDRDTPKSHRRAPEPQVPC
jgi:hypothetical protein